MSGLLATYEWGALPWRKLEVAVFKLQKRIYKASQARDSRRVHQLQRLLLKSRAAKLLAVRRVTQDNRGKHTAGVDGIKSLTPKQRLTTAAPLEALPTGKPARRIWIPKPGKDEQRPLSIPTLYDRARQALVKQAMEPQWEAKFEPNSYGFRPGRSAHDAIGAIYGAINKQPKYVLDADIAKCFDRIDRKALLRKTDTFANLQRLIKPSKEAIKRHYRQLAETINRNKTARQENLIRQLNPVIAGWSYYYRAVVSKKVFHTLDQKLYHRLARWARHRHPQKGRRWVVNRYWRANKGKNWVFGGPNGPALNLHASVAIVRHAKVKGDASPYDGNWSYWATRRGHHPGVSKSLARLLKLQQGRCQACGLVFTPQALIEIHHLDGDHRNNRYCNLAAVHRHCHDQIHGGYHELSQQLGTHDKSLIN
jgi:RNA-directed DNA polymerase